MGGQNSIVRLNNSSGHTGSRVNGKLKLGLLAPFSSEALQKESTETRTGTTTKGVEDEETLEGVAVVWTNLRVSPHFSAQARKLVLPSRVYSPATRRTRSMTVSTISLPMV